MELVDAANACASWKCGSESPDLCIVGGNEKKVLQCERSCAAVRRSVSPPQQVIVNGLHLFDLFIALLDVPIMFDTDKNNAALLGDNAICIGRKCYLLPCAIKV